MSVVEQHARAHIVTDTADRVEDEQRAVPVILRYDPDRDPGAVRVDLPGGDHEWTFDRAVLEQGLRAPAEAPAGSGSVRVWPCGRVQAVVEFHDRHGVSVVQFDTKALMRFLRRTYTTVPVSTAG
ncbi:SsgA family sporulation/cell division regulator [Streptomyces sp. NPDC052687]|uniref:SsgA family sporulation/cell division regulator n=1 Tax=Streptomyces sp. NPDC052687 TaxID=3154759 RepID=UPI003427175C